MSQCSALYDREKEILSERDLGNFISWWYGACNGELWAFLAREDCACQGILRKPNIPGSRGMFQVAVRRLAGGELYDYRCSEDIIR